MVTMGVLETANAGLAEAFKRIDEHEDKDAILIQCAAGRMNYKSGADRLGVDPGALFEYVKRAVMHYEDRDIALATDGDLIDMLRGLTLLLHRKAKDFLSQPVSLENYKAITTTIKGVKDLIKDIVTLNRTLSDTSSIEIKQLNVFIGDLESFLMTDLCGDCQSKAIARLRTSTRKSIESVVIPTEESALESVR